MAPFLFFCVLFKGRKLPAFPAQWPGSSEPSEFLPELRPWFFQISTDKNVRMISRFFVFHGITIRVLRVHSTTSEECQAFVKIKTNQNDSLRLPHVVAAIPERVCAAHGMRQPKRRA